MLLTGNVHTSAAAEEPVPEKQESAETAEMTDPENSGAAENRVFYDFRLSYSFRRGRGFPEQA